MKQQNILKNLGLTDPETTVYLSLLKLGNAEAGIVAKDTGIKRTTMYDILSSLTKKGFATVYFKKNKRTFYPQKPQRIISLFEKKLEAFQNIVPQLQMFDKKQTQALGLRLIQTKAELEQFYLGVLSEYKNGTYCDIGNAVAWEVLAPDFFHAFRKDRAKHNIHTRLLLTHDSQPYNPTEASLLRSYRYLPDTLHFNSMIDIFPDKILIVNPYLATLGVVIAIPAMVDIFQSIFDFLWELVENEKISR